jgi:enediyne biosynthesis protein E4
MNPCLRLCATSFLLLMGCAAREATSVSPRAASVVTVKTRTQQLQTPASCNGAFVEHTLDHVTAMRDLRSSPFEGNGSGVAVGDLDQDGWTDIALGNLNGPSRVLWNAGGFRFVSQPLETALGTPENDVRAVNMVDVNADGWLDLTMTHSSGGVGLWLNDHRRGFVAQSLEFTSTPAYSMLWDDLDGDGRLELVTASYDAMLEAASKNSLLAGGGGVVVYHNTGKTMQAHKIASAAQSLALALLDVNRDGRRDLVVGNDFAVPDEVYLNTSSGWTTATPFARITKNTMGFAIGDTDRDGSLELFATDMKPNFNDVKALAAWMGFMQKTFEKSQYASTQRAENVLQRVSGDGTYRNVAYELGLDSSGWSWSAQFGDLDNDGFEDLYVVNGMIDRVNLAHLPRGELVETNRAWRNTRDGRFATAPDWYLGSTSSGRGMSLADFDNDGRLDVVINNLGAPAQIFENRLCAGKALEVRLRWLGSGNTHALGSSLRLVSRAGAMLREVRSQSGYLSGSDPRVHFGAAQDDTLERLEVTWPDGKVSVVQRPQFGVTLEVTRVERQP